MAAPKKTSTIKSSKIGFGDLDSKLRIAIFVIVAVLVGILTLQLTGASSLSGLQWLKKNKGSGWNFQFNLPSNSGSGGSGINCNNSSGSNVTTGDATAGPGGVANTGGNTACGTK